MPQSPSPTAVSAFTHRWLIASICFFCIACLGVALDGPSNDPPSPRQQSSKQESPSTKDKTSATQSPSSVPRKAPEPATTPAPPNMPAVQPTPQPLTPTPTQPSVGKPVPPDIAGAINNGVLTVQMDPHRLMRELEQDKSHYPIEVWCKDVNTCAAKVVRKVKDTQWQIGLFMNEEVYYQTNRKYAAMGYDFGNGQSFTDTNGVVLHQAVWLKNR